MQIGQKVKVLPLKINYANHKEQVHYDSHIGNTGTIIEIDDDKQHPIKVDFGNLASGWFRFSPNELEIT